MTITYLNKDLIIASGELTPTMKVKRKAVQQNWAGEIEEIYRE
jgi:long-subunit acyl-CoA synthetase (AMP-forming)